MRVRERQHVRLSAAARAFVLVALLGPVLWAQDIAALLALISIGGVWALATLADWRQRLPVMLVITVEAATVGAICGFTIHTSLAVLGALAVPPFTAGLYRSLQGVALALSAQLTAIVVVAFVSYGHLSTDQGFGAFSWCMTGLGLGLVGTFLHTALNEKPDPLAPYHYAQGLIRQLIDISGGLDNGLDPVALGGAILSAVRDDLPTSALVISVPRGDTLTPLVTKAMGASVNINECEDIAVEAWAVGLPVLHDHVFAFPLNTEAGTTAIVAGVLSSRVDPARIGVEDRIRKLMRRLGPSAVHLDTALLFSAFRDAATAEERRRLSREMHDGVAQDIASLGYLVDTLRVGVTSPDAGRADRHAARPDLGRRSGDPTLRGQPAHQRRPEREPRHRHRLDRAQPVRGVRSADPRHPRRAHPTAPPRGRGRAVPHRAGGDEQRRPRTPRRPRSRCTARCTLRKPSSRSPTTAAGSRRPGPPRTVCTS